MADFNDKNTGKGFKVTSFSQLSASLAADAGQKVDNRRHEFFTGLEALKVVPFRAMRGSLSKFFPGLNNPDSLRPGQTPHGRIDTGSASITGSGIIRDTIRNIVYVPVKKNDFIENLVGVGSEVSNSFGSQAYNSVSASLITQFAPLDPTASILFCVEESYSASVDSGSKSLNNTTAAVGSLRIYSGSSTDFEIGVTSQSFSAIDNDGFSGDGRSNFTLDFTDSSFATHWHIRFDFPGAGSERDFSSSLFTPSASLRFPGANSPADTASVVLDNLFGVNVPSGSKVGHSTSLNFNGSTTADGKVRLYGFRTKIAGDSDSGSFYTFPGRSEIAIYSRGNEDNINSASFQYNASSRNAATGSSVFKTLYFLSGSGATSSASADFSGMYVTASGRGSLVHSDVLLRFNPAVGFYSPSGSSTSSIFVQTSSQAVSGLGPTYAQNYIV